jgi:hypothetical protein
MYASSISIIYWFGVWGLGLGVTGELCSRMFLRQLPIIQFWSFIFGKFRYD